MLARTSIADRNGTLTPVRFNIPDLDPGGYPVVACIYQPATQECLGPTPNSAASKLNVLPDPPATTTTTSQDTTTTTSGTGTTVPASTTTLPGELISTTTSSLVLGATTTTVEGDPGTPPGPTGVAFTTTSTSLDLPGGFADQNTDHFPDIEVTAVEVTQGIQDLQNRMPLVAGKRTVVRVYVAADRDPEEGGDSFAGGTVEEPDEVIGPEGWEPVDGLLQIRRGGQDEIIYPVNAPITAYRRGSDRLNGNETLNFEIPDEWAVGEAEITVLVWSFLPETVVTREPDAGNNFAQGTVVFQEAEAPQVIWFRLDTPSGGLNPAQYDNAFEAAVASYMTFHPVAVPNFLQVFATLGPGPIVGDEEVSEEWDYQGKRIRAAEADAIPPRPMGSRRCGANARSDPIVDSHQRRRLDQLEQPERLVEADHHHAGPRRRPHVLHQTRPLCGQRRRWSTRRGWWWWLGMGRPDLPGGSPLVQYRPRRPRGLLRRVRRSRDSTRRVLQQPFRLQRSIPVHGIREQQVGRRLSLLPPYGGLRDRV